MSNIIEELAWRGLIHQATDEPHLRQWLGKERATLYCGFDPTSTSLHVGSLLPVMLLRRFQRAGHKPLALVGGATGMIGDPTGKSEERNLLTPEELAANVAGIQRQLARFLDFSPGPHGAELVNNHDWMGPYGYLQFLRDVGKHFPVNVMLAKDSVKSRLEGEAGISYTEFSYMLLQAYDFVHLHRTHGCRLQIGGSDQWGNITAGIDLARRMDGAQLHGLTAPLLLTGDGRKMGKTERGAVYLSADRTSPYHFYQYFINLPDDDAGRCLRLLTDLARPEIEQLDRARGEAPQLRETQKTLAAELTRLVHGPEGLAAAERATQIFFGAAIEQLSDRELGEIFADVPSRELPRDRLAGEGLALIEALHASGLAASNGEARRTIQQGGAYVNNRRIDDPAARLTPADLASETVIVLRSGKKKYALLRFPS